MILSILGSLALIIAVTIPGAVFMSKLMDWLEPRLTYIPAAVITCVLGMIGQISLALILTHLVKFFVGF
jgi:hypothetical protein